MSAPIVGHDGKPWPQTIDGHVWAMEFNARFPTVSIDDALGWFCNSIMGGYDTAKRETADTIDALLDEVEHWKSEAASWEKQASDRVDDALKFAAERDALIAKVRDREDVLERAGFRRCDISACNCGSWHQVGGFKARFDEIKEAIAEHVDLNGKTLLTAVQEALAERNALARDAARFDWYFGPNVLKPADFMSEYLRGVREQWTPDQWRAAIDAAMKGASDEV